MLSGILGRAGVLLLAAGAVFALYSAIDRAAYKRGVQAERINHQDATRRAELKHNQKIAEKDARNRADAEEHQRKVMELAARNSALQQQIQGQPDEDFICSPDQSVFSDSLSEQLNAIGRD
ncbi:MAG: hypothetical protein GY789_28465 [Hyphomicrobiales bacterium]|nr:hypothetical protein [Hyphomicrobiales bacterium]